MMVTRLLITDKDLPTWKFDDVYYSIEEAIVAIGRTISFHNKSQEINISITKKEQK